MCSGRLPSREIAATWGEVHKPLRSTGQGLVLSAFCRRCVALMELAELALLPSAGVSRGVFRFRAHACVEWPSQVDVSRPMSFPMLAQPWAIFARVGPMCDGIR